jgi:choline dehydrogenase-like flavoprotein
VAEVDLPEQLQGRPWPHVPATPWHHLGTWHHMGTTRMHPSPERGVVDADCKVHGVANLYVAGSSVFPTFGSNFPTFTIVALGLRMAEKIGRQRAGS